ncbi:hypothetical protein WA171_006662, partial [Blastocystis sp. BT1]
MYLEEEVSIPEECKIHIMSHKMPKDMQNEITNLIHPILHSDEDFEDQVIMIRSNLIDKYSSLFHVIGSKSSTIIYQFDGDCMKKMLCCQHGDTYLLIWNTEITEQQIDDHRRVSWLESNMVFLSLMMLTLLSFILLLYTNRFGEYAQSVCETCSQFSDERVFERSIKLFTCFIASLVTGIGVFLFRRKRRHQRIQNEMDEIRK